MTPGRVKRLQMSRGKVMDIYTSAGGDALNQSKYEEKESE